MFQIRPYPAAQPHALDRPKATTTDNAAPEKPRRDAAEQFQSIIHCFRRTRDLLLLRLLSGPVELKSR